MLTRNWSSVIQAQPMARRAYWKQQSSGRICLIVVGFGFDEGRRKPG
jgi:hypothetical protein